MQTWSILIFVTETLMFLVPGSILYSQWKYRWLERAVPGRMTAMGITAKKAFFVHAIMLELLWTAWRSYRTKFDRFISYFVLVLSCFFFFTSKAHLWLFFALILLICTDVYLCSHHLRTLFLTPSAGALVILVKFSNVSSIFCD